MKKSRQFNGRFAVLLVLLASASGCQQLGTWWKQDAPLSQAVPGANLETIGTSQRAPGADELTAAREFERRGELDKALRAYDRALQLDPHRGETYQRLAVLLAKTGDVASADKLFREAQARMAPNGQLLSDHGYCLLLQGRLAEAEGMLRHAMQLDPNSRRAQNNLGVVLARTGRDAEAIATFVGGGATEQSAQNNLRLAMQMKLPVPTAPENELLDPPAADVHNAPQFAAVNYAAPQRKSLPVAEQARWAPQDGRTANAMNASFESVTEVASPAGQAPQAVPPAPGQPPLRQLPVVQAPR